MDIVTPAGRLFRTECIMPSPASKISAHAELVDLLKSQLNALEKQIFGGITDAELLEYEDRRDRISRLCAELIDLDAA